MRALTLIVLASWAAAASAQDFDDKPRKRPASTTTRERAAPTGFLAAPDEEPAEDEGEPPAEEPPEPAKKKKKTDESDAPAWNEAPRGRGVVVVEENTAASHVVRVGEEDPDRAGRPVSGGGGLSLGKRRAGYTTFKANAADDAEEAAVEDEEDPRARRPAKKPARSDPPAAKSKTAPKSRSAPVGFIMPLGNDDEDAESAPAASGRRDDPFGDRDPPTPMPNSRAAPDDEDDPFGPSKGGGSITSDPIPARRSTIGGGSGIPVEEVQVTPYRDEPIRTTKGSTSDRIIAPTGKGTGDAFLVAPSSKTPKKPDSPPAPVRVDPPPEPAPEPQGERVPQDDAPALPRQRRLLSDSPEPEPSAPVRAPVRAPASEPVAVASPVAEPAAVDPFSVDPFAKFDADLRALEGKPVEVPDGVAAPEIKLPEPIEPEEPRRSIAPAPKPEIPAEPDLAVRPIDGGQVKRDEVLRDVDLLGLSFVGALGGAFARDARTGWTPDLAFGGSIEWWPSFLGFGFLDLSFMRASRSLGTEVVSVDSSWNHLGLRAMVVNIASEDLYLAAGGGLLVTQSFAHYIVNDGGAQVADAGVPRVGVDGSFMIGYAFGSILLRLDARVLLRGGMRLDFLPAVGVGFAL